MNRTQTSLLKQFLKERFSLTSELDDYQNIISSIEKGVYFRGMNVWLLVFAILVASIGLNVNSTAVIIGAMLISPLMGPIIGVGLNIAIYDFDFLKHSLKNLSIAVIISILTSFLYFSITPLSDAQSELLSRTNPTIYDVLIALFGGLAGMVAGVTKEKGNAIPGVAIATALMPPLCTSGFGLAVGNPTYFFGALYLFFINAVMISLSAFICARFLNFPLKQELDKNRERIVRNYIYLIVLITVLPSIYFGYRIIQKTIYENSVNRFISNEFNFERTQVLGKKIHYSEQDNSRIEVIVSGEALSEEQINEIKNRMGHYALKASQLIVKQGAMHVQKLDVNQLRSGIIEEIYERNELVIKSKDEKLAFLEKQLLAMQEHFFPVKDIGEEIVALNPSITKTSVVKTAIYDAISQSEVEAIIVILGSEKKLPSAALKILESWLKKRLKSEHIIIVATTSANIANALTVLQKSNTK